MKWYETLFDAMMSAFTSGRLKQAGATPEQIAAGVTGSVDLPTGYSTDAIADANAHRLAALCHEAVANPAWEPRGGTTYCNRAVSFIAQGMGYFGFINDQLANEMISSMASNPAWREEHDFGRIEALAMRGALIIFGLQDHPHGHVCVAFPAKAEDSGTWGGKVPMVCNIGKSNGIIRLSQAFRVADRPLLHAYVLEESIA